MVNLKTTFCDDEALNRI